VARCEDGGFDFEEESVGAQNQRYRRIQDLYGHFPIVPEVVGKVNRCHATASDLALNSVTVGQGRVQPFSYVPA
jgi:hypothetical protein